MAGGRVDGAPVERVVHCLPPFWSHPLNQAPTCGPAPWSQLRPQDVRVHRTRTRYPSRRPAPQQMTDATGQLLDTLADVPAIVLGRRSDVLA